MNQNDKTEEEIRLGIYRWSKIQTAKFLDFVDHVKDDADRIEKIKKYGLRMFMREQDSLLNLIWAFFNSGRIIEPYEVKNSKEFHERDEN